MTGEELIGFIIANHLEDYQVGIYREPGSGPDWLGGGLDAEIDDERKVVIL